jgi:hypothetical protein
MTRVISEKDLQELDDNIKTQRKLALPEGKEIHVSDKLLGKSHTARLCGH